MSTPAYSTAGPANAVSTRQTVLRDEFERAYAHHAIAYAGLPESVAEVVARLVETRSGERYLHESTTQAWEGWKLCAEQDEGAVLMRCPHCEGRLSNEDCVGCAGSLWVLTPQEVRTDEGVLDWLQAHPEFWPEWNASGATGDLRQAVRRAAHRQRSN